MKTYIIAPTVLTACLSISNATAQVVLWENDFGGILQGSGYLGAQYNSNILLQSEGNELADSLVSLNYSFSYEQDLGFLDLDSGLNFSYTSYDLLTSSNRLDVTPYINLQAPLSDGLSVALSGSSELNYGENGDELKGQVDSVGLELSYKTALSRNLLAFADLGVKNVSMDGLYGGYNSSEATLGFIIPTPSNAIFIRLDADQRSYEFGVLGNSSDARKDDIYSITAGSSIGRFNLSATYRTQDSSIEGLDAEAIIISTGVSF